MALHPALTVLHVALLTGTCLCQSALNVSQLHDDLPTLNPNVRPVKNFSHPTEVQVTFHLSSIITLDTASQTLVSNGWMKVVWKNHYMTWDPDRYGGTAWIFPDPEKLWRPRLTVLNTFKDLHPIGGNYVVLTLLSNGEVSWYPGERFETFCRVDTTFFPFDVQRCSWTFFGWAEGINEVVLRSEQPSVVLDTFQENGEWSLMESKAWSETTYFSGLPFSVLVYRVTLRRRPTMLALTVLVPMLVQSVVNVFVFTVPAEAGERLSYSMTSFLSHGVFMSFIVALMPSSSESLSLMAASQSLELVLSALYVLLSILSLRLFHRDHRKHPVPPALQSVIVGIEVMMCLEPPASPRASATTTTVSIRKEMYPEDAAIFTYHQDRPPDTRARAEDDDDDDVTTTTTTTTTTGTTAGFLKGPLNWWARKRKENQEAYSQPQDMTWQRVSRTLDKLLFRVFFTLVMFSAAVAFTVLACLYHLAV